MYVIGIDPGASGALAALVGDDNGNWTAGESLVMPFVDVGLKRPQLDVPAIRDWIRGVETRMTYRCSLFVLERVGYMPPAPGEAARAFTDSTLTERMAVIWGLLQTLDLPHERVRPADWQRVVLGKMPPSRPAKTRAGKGDGGAAPSKARSAKALKAERRKQIKAAVMDFCVRRYGSGSVTPAGGKGGRHEGLADAVALAHYGISKL